MRAVAVEGFGGFHEGLGEGRVGVDGQFQVGGDGAHLDGQRAFGDHFAGADADDADAEHALGARVHDEFGEALVAAQRGGARSARRKFLPDLAGCFMGG